MGTNKKRIFSAIISAAMLASSFTVAVSAEQLDTIAYEVDDNFENSAIENGAPKNWDALNTATVSLEDSDTEHGKSVKVAVAEDAEEAFNGISKTLSSAITESQYLDVVFDFKAAAEQIPAVYFATADSAIAMFFDNGNIYTGEAIASRISVGTYENPSDWHSAKIRVNGYNHTYNITIDGEAVATNKIAGQKDAVSTANTDKRYKLGLVTTIGFVAEKGNECLFDNIAIKKIDRADYRPAQNFSTDFEELNGDGEIPEGFESFNHSTWTDAYWSYIGAGTPEGDSTYGTSLKTATVADKPTGAVYVFREPIKTGTLTIEFDSYVEATDMANYQRVLYLYPASTRTETGTYTGGIVGIQDNGKSSTESVRQIRTYSGTTAKNTEIKKTNLDDVANKWIHNVLVIDFDKNTMEGRIGDDILTGTNNIHSTIKAGLGAIYFQNNSGTKGTKKEGDLYIDNLSVTVEPTTNVGAPITDDFEAYSTLAELKAGGWSVNGTITDARVSFPEESERGKVLKIAREAGVDVQGLVKNISPAVTGGTITLKSSVKLEGSDMKALIYMRKDANNHYPIVAFDPRDDGLIAVGMGGDLTAHKNDSRVFGTGIVAGDWYDVVATIDISRELLSVTVTDPSGKLETQRIANVPFRNLECTGTVDQIASFRFQMQSALGKDLGTATGVYLDDVEIAHTISAPSILPESVSLINYDGKTEDNTTEAAPSVNKIVIDFGGPMNTASLLENVTLTKSNGEAVKFTGTNNPTAYTYTLSIPDMLEPNTTYKLSVPKDTATAGGGTLSDTDFEYEFTTGQGKLAASFEGVKVGGEETTTKDDLLTENLVEVAIKYFNSKNTSNNLFLITGYYDANNMLLSAHYRKMPMDSSVKNVTVKYLEQMDTAIEGVDNVKMFLWNGLDFIYPLTANKDFE